MPLSRYERKARLGHGSYTEIAQRTGRTIGHVSHVLSGRRRDRVVEVATARMLRLPVAEAFPEYYQDRPATPTAA